MVNVIDLKNYHADTIIDCINSIWFGECSNKDRTDYYCTVCDIGTEVITLEDTSVIQQQNIIAIINCGSKEKVYTVIDKLRRLGFSYKCPITNRISSLKCICLVKI